MPPDTLERATDILEGRRSILVFTGAGISTESGIPDFRGPDGLWTRVDPEDFTIDRYLASPEIRVRRWEMHRTGQLWGARSEVRPNTAHEAIVRLERGGLLAGCITQNIDGLHQAAGLPDRTLAEVHGNTRRSACVDCGAVWPTDEILAWVDEGMADPVCPHCSGIVKPTTVMFGEMLPPLEIAKAEEFAERADAVLAVGTTMSVYPATGFALMPVRRGAPLVILNQGATDHDASAAVLIDGSAGDLLPRLVDRLVA